MAQPSLIRKASKPLVFLSCLLPFAWLVWLAFTGGLGANPVESINRYLGDWALRFMLIALAVTPLRILSNWAGIVRFRRMLGLFAFFYVSLHISSYVGIDQFFDWRAIGVDILKRNYITVGMATFLMLVPLAATSTAAMTKRLGGARWKKLHRLAYAAGVGGVIHYFMMVKADVREPLIYAGILIALFAIRWISRLRGRRR